jgi:hypothetical protein
MENFEKRIFQLKQDEGNTVGEANLKVYIWILQETIWSKGYKLFLYIVEERWDTTIISRGKCYSYIWLH